MHHRILFVSLLVSLCMVAGCQERERDRAIADELAMTLDTYIEAVTERFEIPGLTIAVTRGGAVIYTGAFALRSLDSGEPMEPNYLFHMASVSKPFVATAVMQLAPCNSSVGNRVRIAP